MNPDEATRAHSDWKIKLRRLIAEKGKADVTTLAKDDQCELGKWLHGEESAAHRSTKEHADCKHAHAEFHREAAKVAGAINEGRFEQANAMLDAGTPYASAAFSVSVALGALKKVLR